MRFSFAALSVLSALSAVYAESDVFDLTGATFDDFFKGESTGPVLLEFFAPWCGHCKNLAPKYEEAATILKPQGIRLAKIDCVESTNTELCARFGVQGYPTLKVVVNNDVKEAKDYPGQRTTEAIVSYLEKKGKPAVEAVTADTIADFKSHNVVFVAYHAASDSKTPEVLEVVAKSFDDKPYRFGSVSDAEVAKADGVKVPSIVAYRTFDEPKTVYDGKINKDDLAKFVKLSAMHVLGEVNPETYASYAEAKMPLAYLFAYTEEERKDWATKLYDVAKAHKAELNIATIDAKDYGQHAENLNLEVDKWPAFVIHDMSNNKKYPISQAEALTPEIVQSFIKDYAAGKLKPTIKSEPIPDAATQAETAVTIVVAHNYKEIVLDDDKDVLVEYYAPWCGHCKALAPVYEELAQKYKDHPEGAKKIVIAKVDATANDVDAQIQGFPTIELYPAGKKDSPVRFQDARTAQSLAKFVAEHGTHGLDAFVEEEKPAEKAAESASETPSASETSSSSSKSEASKESEEVKQEL